MKTKISITINEKILRDIDSVIDNIFIRNRSQAIEHFITEAMKDHKIAVILAGDSRKPTPGKIIERYSLKVNGLTLIEKEIEKLVKWGFKTIYIIANHKTLTNIFKIVGDGSKYNAKIEYVDEEVSNGTASAIRLLKNKIKKTFLLVYCDTLLDNLNIPELWNNHLKEKVTATILASSTIIPKNESMFGKLKLEGSKVISFFEKTTPSKINSSIYSRGIYVLEPEIFSYYGNDLENDIFPELVKRRVLGAIITSADHLHIHSHKDLINVRKKLKQLSKH